MISHADFLSLHLPLLPETRCLVDAPFLARMKPGAYLINTARGEVVDEMALAQVLQSGRLGGAALDALTREPPEPDLPLLNLPPTIAPNVIITPPLGAQTDGSTNQMGWMALNDCLAVLRGEAPAHRVA